MVHNTPKPKRSFVQETGYVTLGLEAAIGAPGTEGSAGPPGGRCDACSTRFMVQPLPPSFDSVTVQKRPPEGAVGRCPAARAAPCSGQVDLLDGLLCKTRQSIGQVGPPTNRFVR